MDWAALALAVVSAAVVWLYARLFALRWRLPADALEPDESGVVHPGTCDSLTASEALVSQLQNAVADLAARIRQCASMRELRSLEARVKALEQAAASSGSPDSAGRQALEERIAQLEQALGPDAQSQEMLSQLQSRLQALESAPGRSTALQKAVKDLSGRTDALEAGLAEVREGLAGIPALTQALEQTAARLEALEAAGPEQPGGAGRIESGAQPGPDEEDAAAPRRPRVLSAEARAHYHEVVTMWARGKDIDAIVEASGLDRREVEMMLAGERPQLGA